MAARGGCMSWSNETICDFGANRERIRARKYGVIETTGGELRAVHLRAWPKMFALPELLPLGPGYHGPGDADRCLLYYNQPRRMPNFLALKYVVTTLGTSYQTFRAALRALDAIAELKGIDAIVCDATNMRLSERFMARMGWEPHKPQRWHRNFIRRFYGVYPEHRGVMALLAKSQQFTEPQALQMPGSVELDLVAGLSR
jgi:hypothetical protein